MAFGPITAAGPCECCGGCCADRVWPDNLFATVGLVVGCNPFCPFGANVGGSFPLARQGTPAPGAEITWSGSFTDAGGATANVTVSLHNDPCNPLECPDIVGTGDLSCCKVYRLSGGTSGYVCDATLAGVCQRTVGCAPVDASAMCTMGCPPGDWPADSVCRLILSVFE